MGVLFKFNNALIAFFYEGEKINLGTLAVAMPQFGGRTCISSILLGERNAILTKILAERFSNASQGIALVSIHLPELHETETSAVLLKLAKRLLDKSGLN